MGKKTVSPFVGIAQALGKDVGKIARSLDTLSQRSGEGKQSSPASTSTNGIHNEDTIKGILNELVLARQAQQKLTAVSGEWKDALSVFGSDSSSSLPTKETYGVRYYPNDDSASSETMEVSVPNHLVGKTGFYRHRVANDSWEMEVYSPMLFGKTLTLSLYGWDAEYVDVEFFIVNNLDFKPDEEVRL